jgi:uncharacterized protein YaaW (UPF0174 family)
MAYVADSDLEFFGMCTADELDPLVRYIMFDSDGQPRRTESLSTHADYLRYKPDHPKYWQVIAGEMQHFAGNTITNTIRGHGVLYREALNDVCDKLKVNYSSAAKTSFVESALLQKILTDSLDKMTEEERRALVKELALNTTDFSKEAVVAAMQIGTRLGGFFVYRMALVVANSVARLILGRGLTLAANRAVTQSIGAFAGPVGWAFTAIWTAIEVAGPAYRVTIPCVVQTAFLRALKSLPPNTPA